MADPVHYVLIESQGTWSGPNADRFLADGVALAEAGHSLRVFLVQDGVFAALPGATSTVDKLAAAGAQVWADDFSLAQRALTASPLSPHVATVGMDEVAKAVLEDGSRVVWH